MFGGSYGMRKLLKFQSGISTRTDASRPPLVVDAGGVGF